MSDYRIDIGELRVLVMGQNLPLRALSDWEKSAIASELGSQLKNRLEAHFEGEFIVEIKEVRSGCLLIVVNIVVIVGAITTAVANYPRIKSGARELWGDMRKLFVSTETRKCIAQFSQHRFLADIYGPVKEGQSLNEIIANLDHEEIGLAGVTIEQIMMSTFRINNEAFSENNINLLRVGAFLRIPGLQFVQSISESEAAEQIALHNRYYNFG